MMQSTMIGKQVEPELNQLEKQFTIQRLGEGTAASVGGSERTS
jgi:hypothetical protein